MFRPPSNEGLGVLNVRLKAQAALIKTFLETSGSAQFMPSLYHCTLYRYHVLGDTSLPNPGIPPFYSRDFFSKIGQVHFEIPLNVLKVSEKEWPEGENSSREYIPCRVERADLGTDWDSCWRLVLTSSQSEVRSGKSAFRHECEARGTKGRFP